jgi:uncharacterized membrane protein YagU involved in acid resistance
MTTHSNRAVSTIAGAVSGLIGTAVMMGMRSFDQQYAPKTLPEMREEPGIFIADRIQGDLQRALLRQTRNLSAFLLSLGYGLSAGVVYARVRGRRKVTSPLLDGTILGVVLYLFAYVAWLPITGLTRPIWKQRYPQVAGEALRHVVFGIATAAVYRAINGRRKSISHRGTPREGTL